MATLNTIAGFFRVFISRYTPLKLKSNSIDDIYNYLLIDGLFATSGQPSEKQFELIRAAGYRTVINLSPTSILENSIIDERAILKALGINYIHISVDFTNPTEQDFEKFVREIEKENVSSNKLWIHCAANMRVSAFTYRYRVDILDKDKRQAKNDLFKIWSPIGVWKKFVGFKENTQ